MRRPDDSPETYVSSIDDPKLRAMLEQVRDLIRTEFPAATEGIEYGMLDYAGLANLAAQKNYVALYVSSEVLEAHRDLVDGIDCGKSCIRFKRPEQVNIDNIRTLLTHVDARRG